MRELFRRSAIAARRTLTSNFTLLLALTGACDTGKTIALYNGLPSTSIRVVVRHGDEEFSAPSILARSLVYVKLPWGTRESYEVFVLQGAADKVLIGSCRVLHRWADGLDIEVQSVDPPVLRCLEHG